MTSGSIRSMVEKVNLPEPSEMTEEDLIGLFDRSGAVLTNGHFQLRSGWHSPVFIQYSRIAQDPTNTEKLSRALALLWQGEKPDVVLGPVTIGMLLAEGVARHLGVRVAFATADPAGVFTGLRKGFTVWSGERVLIVNDVTTTGLGVEQLAAIARESGGIVAGVALVASRTPAVLQHLRAATSVNVLLELNILSYKSEADCPQCRAGDKPEESSGYR